MGKNYCNGPLYHMLLPPPPPPPTPFSIDNTKINHRSLFILGERKPVGSKMHKYAVAVQKRSYHIYVLYH